MPDSIVDAILASGADKYSVCFNGEYIFTHAGDYTIISKAIDGNYPDYRRVIPTNRTTGLPFNTEPFKGILKRVKELDKASKIRGTLIRVYENGMVEYAGNREIKESFGKLLASRPPIDIGFNCDLLARGDIAGLAYFGGVRDPVLVLDDKKTFVIMPVRI